MAQKVNEDHVFYRTPTKFYPTVDRGEGVYIYDKEGKQYIDGSGGAAVVNIGHGVKEVEQAMLKQASRIAFTHGTQFTSEAAVELADRIVKMSPPGLSRVYFLSGGSEAVETAMKMARQYQVDRGNPMKFKVISRWASYHGNTVGALALSGHTGRRRYYLPLMLHTPHIAPCYCYRCPFNLVPEKCSVECADELEKPSSTKVPIPCRPSSPSPSWGPRRAPWCRRTATSGASARSATSTTCCSSPTRSCRAWGGRAGTGPSITGTWCPT